MSLDRCSDPDHLLVEVLDRLIAAASVARHRLRVPLPRGRQRPGPGQHLHYTPETFLQVSGWVDFALPDESFRLRAGGICVMPVGTPHGETVGDGPGQFRHFVIMFTATTIAWHLKEFADQRAQPLLVHPDRIIRSASAPRAIACLAELTEAARSRHAGGKALVQGLLLTYLAMLRAAVAGAAPTSGEALPIARCRHEVMRRLADPRLSVAGLAAMVGWSANHLSQRFHHETGIRLVEHIQRQRIDQAKALLADPALEIKQVGAAVGMPDASYFARVFRARVGLTPRQYRERGVDGSPLSSDRSEKYPSGGR